MNRYISILVIAFVGFLATTANAALIDCSEPADPAVKNYMSVADTQVSACVSSGLGNINGHLLNDAFLFSGGTAAGYVGVGDGDFTISSDFSNIGTWDTGPLSAAQVATVDAVGFKFGTGSTPNPGGPATPNPDQWFVYDLVAGVTSGTWEFTNVFSTGGELSHVYFYTTDRSVPEPGMVALLAIGLLGMVVARRRMKV